MLEGAQQLWLPLGADNACYATASRSKYQQGTFSAVGEVHNIILASPANPLEILLIQSFQIKFAIPKIIWIWAIHVFYQFIFNTFEIF